jgi:hypothetical protein
VGSAGLGGGLVGSAGLGGGWWVRPGWVGGLVGSARPGGGMVASARLASAGGGFRWEIHEFLWSPCGGGNGDTRGHSALPGAWWSPCCGRGRQTQKWFGRCLDGWLGNAAAPRSLIRRQEFWLRARSANRLSVAGGGTARRCSGMSATPRHPTAVGEPVAVAAEDAFSRDQPGQPHPGHRNHRRHRSPVGHRNPSAPAPPERNSGPDGDFDITGHRFQISGLFAFCPAAGQPGSVEGANGVAPTWAAKSVQLVMVARSGWATGRCRRMPQRRVAAQARAAVVAGKTTVTFGDKWRCSAREVWGALRLGRCGAR